MANSKDDTKQRKVIDVTAPGKSAPPATSKPVIVTNRPMLHRDPMMAPTPDGLEKTGEHNTMIPVSRVAKTIKVSSLAPVRAGEPADVPQETGEDNPAPGTPAADVDQKIALEVGEEALAGIEPPAADASRVSDSPDAPAVATDTLVSDATPVAVQHKPEPEPSSAQPMLSGPEQAPEAEAAPRPAPEAEADVPQPATEPAPASAVPAVSSSVPDDPADDPTDDQLAPNQAVDESQRKQQQEEAARQAEVEKVVASKQYFLPVRNTAEKRSTRTAVLILILVILLALLWLDVVLDAGLVHISGVHALTHLFSAAL